MFPCQEQLFAISRNLFSSEIELRLFFQHRRRNTGYREILILCTTVFYTYFYTRANLVRTKMAIFIFGNIVFGATMKRRKLNL